MNTEIRSPVHIEVAAFLGRNPKRSGFVAIVLLLGTLGVLGGSQMTLIGWLALIPWGEPYGCSSSPSGDRWPGKQRPRRKRR